MTGYENINAYKKSFGNVDKINQVIMLFDTAIASLQQAKQAIVEKKIEEKFNKISKVFKILTGLRDSLDHGTGGELAVTLSEWYNGTIYRVLHVGRTEDVKLCEMCIEHIKQMRAAWAEVESQVKGGVSGANESEGDNKESSSSNDDYFETLAKAAYAGNAGLVISV